jgi:hypothetical protein
MPTPLSESLESWLKAAPSEVRTPPRPDRIQAFQHKLASYAQQTDQVLFDGHWLSAEDAFRRYRRLRWGSWLKILEMVLLFFFALQLVMIPVAVLALFGVIAG